MNIFQLWELKNHWDEIGKIICYIIAAASVIVKLTPTLKDNTVLLKIVKFVSKYVALNRKTKDDIIRKGKKK